MLRLHVIDAIRYVPSNKQDELYALMTEGDLIPFDEICKILDVHQSLYMLKALPKDAQPALRNLACDIAETVLPLTPQYVQSPPLIIRAARKITQHTSPLSLVNGRKTIDSILCHSRAQSAAMRAVRSTFEDDVNVAVLRASQWAHDACGHEGIPCAVPTVFKNWLTQDK